MKGKYDNRDEEMADLYIYRHFAESKARKIGAITRILKENAVDCHYNRRVVLNDIIKEIQLSNGEMIKYNMKDRDKSMIV